MGCNVEFGFFPPRFNEPLRGAFSVTSLDDKIYMTGGHRGGGHHQPQQPQQPHHAVDRYDPATNTVEEHVSSTRESDLSLCTTMRVMHENFGL